MPCSKGIATSQIQILTALITLGVIAAFMFLIMGYFTDLESEIKYQEVERQNINLAQVIISSPLIAYNDGHMTSRGVIDWGKATHQLTGGSELLKEVGYPNSFIVLGIRNLDTDEHIEVSYIGPTSVSSAIQTSAITNFFGTCLAPHIGWDTLLSFIAKGSVGAAFNMWDPGRIDPCMNSLSNKYGTEVRTFPIAIKKGGSVYPGILRVTIMEAW
jgi:hypothetical protein